MRAPALLLSALLAPAVLVDAGCIEHDARVLPDPAHSQNEHVVIGTHALDGPAGTEVSRALPIDLPITAWEMRDNALRRREERLRTPLVWWQRFPFDMAADLVPMTFTASAETTLTLAPPVHYDDDALTQEARRHGFAHD